MNRVEFLAELEQRLSGIPEEERQAAIQYYADYLADAGEENEDEAIRELGSPEKAAESIKADYYGTEFDESRFDHKDYMEKYGQRSNQEGGPDNRSGAAPGSDGQGNGQSQKSAPWTSRGLKILLIILIAIVVWPVTLGVAGVVLGVAAAVFGILFGLGSVFFYSHELLVRVHLEKTALIAGAAVVLAALACEKAGIPADFFIRITMEIYGPLLFLLLILAGIGGRKKKFMKVGLLCFSLILLSGCGISLEDRVFPLSMGVEYENGHYQVVYGIPQLSKVTGQSKEGGESGEKQALVYEGLTLQDAQERFNENQENYLDMGHIKALILGEKLLADREAMAGLLGFLEENPAVAGNIYVFAAEDMEEVMSLDGQETDSLGDYLTGILENTLEKKEKQAAVLQDLYGAWHREEEFPELLEVTVVNKKPRIRQHS